MNLVLGWLRAFGRFWYGFIVGDDWTLAATVVAALIATWWLHTAGIAAWWVVPFAAAGALVVSLRRAGP